MTLWQDQMSRQNRSGVAPSSAEAEGRPLSRREARERERQAAEALAAGRVHPSGVMDFDGHDLRDEVGPDQEFRVHDTADIWAALNRRSDLPGGGVDRLGGAQPSIPSAGVASAAELAARGGAPATPGTGLPPVTDDLMDRVRGAVLGRERSQLGPAAQRPQTRREMRAQQSPEEVDALPASWFSDTGQAARPAQAAPAAFSGFPDYADEPTVAMPALDRAALDAQAPVTAAVDLPRFFTEPVGNDDLTFSAPMEREVAEPLAAHPYADAEAAFLEPQPSRWIEPEQPRFAEPSTETTDVPTSLAGFESLITKARGTAAPQRAAAPGQQPPAALAQPQLRDIQQPAARPAPVWKDDEEDETEVAGFSGLLSRGVGAPSGSQNALILPHDPQPDFTQAISGSGDIFITGTHHLPRSVAERGAAAHQVDSREMDRLYEAAHDEPASGVSPVRATNAVSGGMTGRSPIARRSYSAALPTVLAVIAGLMAVGVIVMLVGSWVLRLF